MSKSRINIKRDKKPKSTDDFFSNFEIEDKQPDRAKDPCVDNKKCIRQTFVLRQVLLDKLRDFVHTKKLREDYNYTQKQALEEALQLLFKTVDKIENRNPDEKD